ncbi:ring-1,2-phenylacetyl-CoA epoxidase subunit PaaD [Tamaricihabitans halophyticus]|uniref:Ring-1,2-phenylacetyl-CoA epoxidase subunit PaaD n=1 Tax=Tamaricihabitans halophyticus TaxID=1262583 RepID=A0A4R2QME9_9PSEU|nr:1,2-phenylacetyl-CoA epoxidase subunit PaaD [Tamaricihabitans halophyticus]TCP50024.1 ring-1,2-phenylacetyl-CoA epoxidase subunit PaaD [Tamaricihabitans halophyticus]
MSAEDHGPAYAVAATVTDPELPVLTLAELGILREVRDVDDAVVVSITPTYSGCPAMAQMRADLTDALRAAGYATVEVRTVLHPPWTTDWISETGRRKLAAAGIAPPGPARTEAVVLPLAAPPSRVRCPRCGCPDTVEISRFSGTACKALRRCPNCVEPFEHLKEI